MTVWSCMVTVMMTLWQTGMVALLMSARSCWPRGEVLTRAGPLTSGALAYLCTLCWLDDTRFRTRSQLHCSPRSAVGPSPCLTGCHHRPSVWLAACWGNHLQSGYRHQSCWCIHGWPILARHITTHTRCITTHKKLYRVHKMMTNKWCQYGQRNKNKTHICTSALVRPTIWHYLSIWS